jgi:hypothetical protein
VKTTPTETGNPPPPPKNKPGAEPGAEPGNGAESEPQNADPNARQNRKSEGELREEHRRKIANYKMPNFTPSPGDGEAVSLNEALQALQKGKNAARLISGHDGFVTMWHNIFRLPGEPTGLAVRYSGLVWIDFEMLSEAQQAEFLAADQAANPEDYR